MLDYDKALQGVRVCCRGAREDYNFKSSGQKRLQREGDILAKA